MAETLGSLIDKLTIKDIREFHLRQMRGERGSAFSRKELDRKLTLLARQKDQIMGEIDAFVVLAAQGRVQLREEKLKLYNPREAMGRIPKTARLAQAISGLAQKNLELWHLEDEARRKDVTLSYVGGIKGKIDRANQQRNDLIDRIDELFQLHIRKAKR